MVTKTTPRKAVTGTCPRCGTRTVRGELNDGRVVEAEPHNLSAADELRAHAVGTATYRATWRNAIQLDERTPRDIKINPAGFDGSRIWKEHSCPAT